MENKIEKTKENNNEENKKETDSMQDGLISRSAVYVGPYYHSGHSGQGEQRTALDPKYLR